MSQFCMIPVLASDIIQFLWSFIESQREKMDMNWDRKDNPTHICDMDTLMT